MIMILIQLVIILVIVGLLLWVVQQFLPVPVVIKNVIHVLVILIVILYLLRVFGIVHL